LVAASSAAFCTAAAGVCDEISQRRQMRVFRISLQIRIRVAPTLTAAVAAAPKSSSGVRDAGKKVSRNIPARNGSGGGVLMKRGHLKKTYARQSVQFVEQKSEPADRRSLIH
jgi:hypothetical protein